MAINKTNSDGSELLALVSERLNAELAPLASIRTELTGFKSSLVARISVEVDRIVDAIADGNAISADRDRAFSNEIKSIIDNQIEKITACTPDADGLAEQVSARLLSTAGLASQAGHLSIQGGRPSLVVPFIDQTEKARAVLDEPAEARSAAEFIRNYPGLAEILSEATGKTGTLDRGSDCFDIPVTG